MDRMNQTKLIFYKKKLRDFENLKYNCQRPDRIAQIIEAYKEELRREIK